jgi:ABC-type polysaccharide/polyol phosphate transport system ATPase subunit
MSGPQAPAVAVDGVSKTFSIPKEHVHTLKERVLHPLRRPGHDVIQALREVSFSVQPGEFFGIVGRNGSGKSTLLKCLAGIYRTDRGRIYANGQMSTFIELGVGFNPDLAAYDNVVINATMLGLPPKDARKRFDSIIEFAELEDYTDLKLKNYSSGMMVRLAFAVMIQVDAEILLIDEVLAVGDAAFQQKCYDEFARIHDSGATVLLVTHDMAAVRRFCSRAMLLENGRAVQIGDPEEVGNSYLELNFSRKARQRASGVDETQVVAPPDPTHEPGERRGDGAAVIEDAWIEDDQGQRTDHLATGRRCVIVAQVVFQQETFNPLFAFELTNDQRLSIIQTSNAYQSAAGAYKPGERAVLRFEFDATLAPGRYFVSPSVAHSGAGYSLMDAVDRMTSVIITGAVGTTAILSLPDEIAIERHPASTEEMVS